MSPVGEGWGGVWAHLGILGQKMNRITVGKEERDIIGEGNDDDNDKKENENNETMKKKKTGLPPAMQDETA